MLKGDLHGAECENETDSYFLLSVHLQSVNNEYGDNAERPIRDTAQCGVPVERVDNNGRWNALALSTAELLPEEGYRPALEGEDEEEVNTVGLDGDEGNPKNDAVRSLDSNSKQENTNAGFEEDIRDNISRFAGPPPLVTEH
jgi:hypothetical protein